MKKILILIVLSVFWTLGSQSQNSSKTSKNHYEYFLDFIKPNNSKTRQIAYKYINKHWTESDEILLLETIYLTKNPHTSDKLLLLLQKKTGLLINYNFNKWYRYIWNKPATYNKQYFSFKAELNQTIDSRFYTYFKDRDTLINIRLDEVRWGGVKQDGIPPLRNPNMITANKANYLNDTDVVFGIEINGEFRAYPKRILAWHEMFTDTINGVPLAGVYCTLCGTVILYKTQHNGINYELGTSGFLYRSNKMMYDKKTQSLWSTALGKPILGPLVNKNIELEYLSVVTTTWGAWKSLHPKTTVLSLNTGYKRNYNEGIAYKNYFSTDNLMFNTPKTTKRLKNKDEVLVVKDIKSGAEVIAIASKFLVTNKIYHNTLNGKPFVVITSKSGAHRVYYSENINMHFKYYDNQFNTLKSSNLDTWLIEENSLIETKTNKKLQRLHSYNAFWFGILATYNNVKLIK